MNTMIGPEDEPPEIDPAQAEQQRRGLVDQLARVRLSPGQIQVAVVLCVILSVGSISIALASFSTRVDVADERSARATAGLEQLVEKVAAQQVASDQSTCRILALGRRKPGEPPPSTALGAARSAQYEAEYRRRGCPP